MTPEQKTKRIGELRETVSRGEERRQAWQFLRPLIEEVQEQLISEVKAYARANPDDDRGVAARFRDVCALDRVAEHMLGPMASAKRAQKELDEWKEITERQHD